MASTNYGASSSSMPTTTLQRQRATSGTASDQEILSEPKQNASIEFMRCHLDGCVWGFTCDDLATMISPKGPDGALFIDCSSAKEALATARLPEPPILVKQERLNYGPLAVFLNSASEIVDEVHKAVAMPLSVTASWTGRLYFCAYDNQTVDGVLGASPLKPDLTGHSVEPSTGFRACWSTPQKGLAANEHLIRIAVEVKDDWPELLYHVATFARASQSGTPLRKFVPCIGINHIKEEFCVFVFHAGGVAASTPLSLAMDESRRSLLRFLLAMQLWRNMHDAGEPPMSNGLIYRLPLRTDDALWTDFMLEKILHHRLNLCGRKSFVIRVRRVVKTSSSAISALQPTVSSARGLSPVSQSGACSTQQSGTHVSNRLKRKPEDDLTAGEYSRASKSLRVASSSSQLRSSQSLAARSSPTSSQPPVAIRPNYDPTCVLSTPEESAVTRANDLRPVPEEAVLKFSWQLTEKADVEAETLLRCNGCFGTPSFLCSLRLGHNHDLLPLSTGEAQWWPCLGKETALPVLDHRELVATVCADSGASLEYCKSAWDLGRALLDCQLGWLGLLQRDRLHRDISVGNLLLLDQPVTRFAFESKLPDRLKGQGLDELIGQHREISQRLRQALADLGVRTECTAIIMDFDLVARLDSSDRGRRHLPGTREFMSTNMLRALKHGSSHSQGVVDDIAAFLNVAFWAALFNTTCAGESRTESMWRDEVRASYQVRDSAHEDIVGRTYHGRLSDFLEAFRPVLRDWRQHVKGYLDASLQPLAQEAELLQCDLKEQYLAVESVLAFANILLKHRDDLMKP